MLELDVKGHPDMCGGYGYSGVASFEGKTVKDVLEEIKEYAKDKEASYLGEGFGNPKSNCCDCWAIRINGDTYLSEWAEPKWRTHIDDINNYLDLKVKEIKVDGGWYCFYDFNIITE